MRLIFFPTDIKSCLRLLSLPLMVIDFLFRRDAVGVFAQYSRGGIQLS
jgi:hypothetical protein